VTTRPSIATTEVTARMRTFLFVMRGTISLSAGAVRMSWCRACAFR
jgi:hypothetical protein